MEITGLANTRADALVILMTNVKQWLGSTTDPPIRANTRRDEPTVHVDRQGKKALTI